MVRYWHREPFCSSHSSAFTNAQVSFANRNVTKGAAKIKVPVFELLTPDLKLWVPWWSELWLYSKTEIKCSSKCAIHNVCHFDYGNNWTIDLQLQIQNTGVWIIVCVCKPRASTFWDVSVNFDLQILIWQLCTFILASSRVLLLIYLHNQEATFSSLWWYTSALCVRSALQSTHPDHVIFIPISVSVSVSLSLTPSFTPLLEVILM